MAVILVFMLVLPFMFKDKVITIVKKEANEMLNAKLDFESLDISLFSHFPSASIELNGLTLSGIDDFENDTLVSAESIDVAVNVMSLFSDKGFDVNYVVLDKPSIKAVKLADGRVNWDIMKPDTADVEEVCAAAGRCCCISDAVAQKLSDTPSPQGIFCVLPIPQPPVFGGRGKYIGFENLADPSNLGAAARTAEALGLDGILLFGAGCDPYAPKAQRAAMGALVRLPVHTFPSVAEFAARYPAVNTYAAVVKGGIPVSQADFSAPCMVLIGNEANGLSEQAAALCTQRVTLPMYGRAESLNAAVAAAIFMWEMVR